MADIKGTKQILDSTLFKAAKDAEDLVKKKQAELDSARELLIAERTKATMTDQLVIDARGKVASTQVSLDSKKSVYDKAVTEEADKKTELKIAKEGLETVISGANTAKAGLDSAAKSYNEIVAKKDELTKLQIKYGQHPIQTTLYYNVSEQLTKLKPEREFLEQQMKSAQEKYQPFEKMVEVNKASVRDSEAEYSFANTKFMTARDDFTAAQSELLTAKESCKNTEAQQTKAKEGLDKANTDVLSVGKELNAAKETSASAQTALITDIKSKIENTPWQLGFGGEKIQKADGTGTKVPKRASEIHKLITQYENTAKEGNADSKALDTLYNQILQKAEEGSLGSRHQKEPTKDFYKEMKGRLQELKSAEKPVEKELGKDNDNSMDIPKLG